MLYGAGEVRSAPTDRKSRMRLAQHVQASIGIGMLIQMMLQETGPSKEEALKRIFLIDSKGLIVKSRTNLTEHKKHFVQDMPEMKDLHDIIKAVKPTALLGTAQLRRLEYNSFSF